MRNSVKKWHFRLWGQTYEMDDTEVPFSWIGYRDEHCTKSLEGSQSVNYLLELSNEQSPPFYDSISMVACEFWKLAPRGHLFKTISPVPSSFYMSLMNCRTTIASENASASCFPSLLSIVLSSFKVICPCTRTQLLAVIGSLGTGACPRLTVTIITGPTPDRSRIASGLHCHHRLTHCERIAYASVEALDPRTSELVSSWAPSKGS